MRKTELLRRLRGLPGNPLIVRRALESDSAGQPLPEWCLASFYNCTGIRNGRISKLIRKLDLINYLKLIDSNPTIRVFEDLEWKDAVCVLPVEGRPDAIAILGFPQAMGWWGHPIQLDQGLRVS